MDRSDASAVGDGPTQPLQALWLQLHNAVGQPWDVVALNLATDDVDGAGQRDTPELEPMPDLDGDTTRDRDRDGAPDHAEFAAGTDPLDATSSLRLLPPEVAGGPWVWTSAAGRTYALERAESPGGPFTTVQAGITATPPLNRFTDSSGGGIPAGFYRVRVE